MLSQIERNQANPTLGVAFRIAQAFGMNLGDLVDVPDATPRIDVVRRNDRTYHYSSSESVMIRTLSPPHLEKDVEFYELTLRVGGALVSEPHFSGVREVLTVAGSIASRNARGGTAGERVAEQLADLRGAVEAARAALTA